MVRDGVEEIVGEQLVGAPRAAREGTRYSCRYTFADGSVVLTVEDLGTPEKARAEITDQLVQPDVRDALPGLAEGAVWKTNGNLVLSKDEYVLTVDVTRLPEPNDKHAASLRTAEAVLGCW